MFRLLKLEVVHWDYWQRFTAPLDASIVTIVGPNGSGKTTLLDALRTLFALDCSKKRDYKRYARKNGEEFCWLRGVVDNTRSTYGRHPFFPILSNEVTIACRIDKKGGEWARHYCILEGEAEIEQLKEVGDWVGVIEYRRRLLDAGLSPAMEEVLSLEQGQTDRLCDLKPRELLDLVFHVFGEKAVLDRYREAKLHQEETSRELKEIDTQLANLSLNIAQRVIEVNNYHQWKDLREERERLAAEIKPRLEYQQSVVSVRGARVQITGARREWRAKRSEHAAAFAELPKLEAAIASAKERQQKAQQAETEANKTFGDLRENIGQKQQLLKERERLTRLAREGGMDDPQSSARQLGELKRSRTELELQLLSWRKELAAANNDLELLRSGGRADPEDVRAMRAALDEVAIPHDLLAEIVEVRDESWQAAIEAALAPFRHVILLRDERYRGRAFALGEKMRYRHFIVPELAETPTATVGSLLEIVRIARAAPAWLAQLLDRTQRVEDARAGARLPRGQDWMTRAGYLRERRGGRYARPTDFAFGRARLKGLAQLCDELQARVDEAEPRGTVLAEDIARIEALLAGYDAPRELALRAEEFADAETALAAAQESARDLGQRIAQLQSAKTRADAVYLDSENALRTQRNNIAALAKAIQDAEQKPVRNDQLQRLRRLRHDRKQLPPAWCDEIANAGLAVKWESPAAVAREIERFEHRLRTEEWITDATVEELLAKLREDHAQQSQEQERRRAENERASALTAAAREAYVDYLRATVRQYTKNLKALGEIAQVKVEAQLPLLAADDVTLAQAGLDVKFDFDQKGFIGMNDGDASGGQQVIKSLILLIALMMEESRPGGFVFIDEPFAHLDIFNIDRVASFLRATRAQYLITTPITHNVNVYDPSMLTLVTFKKRPNEKWAPRIGKLVRAHA
ncbi:MAG: AAA family ATPase [Burkholderiales bacterium]|nr:AAA family ATPase [Burkholderiales bacterium]